MTLRHLLPALLLTAAFAQATKPSAPSTPKPPADDPAPAPPISMDDKFQGRTLQLQESQMVQQLESTPQYSAAVAAQSERARFFNSLYAKYKVDAQKFTVCDGPAPGAPACSGVAKGDIAFRPNLPPATPAAAEKK